MKMKQLTLCIITACCISAPALADVSGDLNGYFNGLGYSGNVSKAQSWKGQSANYMTGGSVYLRNPVKNIQLISMQVPSVNSGCGGIDAYLGAFSFISGAQIQAFAKQIMSNAGGYAFDLALQTMVPELKQAKDYLEKMASDVNSMNMSSCQAAQGIIGGLWPVSQVSQTKICQDISGQDNIFSDWASSRQGCTVGGDQDSVNGRADATQKDLVLKNKNLIWDALGVNHVFDDNQQLKQFVMSIVGSIIFNNSGQVTILQPLVADRGVVNTLMEGGDAKVYLCDTTDVCLKPSVGTITISESNSLVTMVRNYITSLQNSVMTDTPLTDTQKGFINSTSVPVLKYIINSSSLGIDATYLSMVSDYIAQDLMIQYLQELVTQANASLSAKNFPEQAAKELKANISSAQTLLVDMKLQSSASQTALDSINRNMQYLQQQVSTQLTSSYQSNYNWGN
ncbi:conjugal transfer protein TraH [Rouxiella silvae]|uniref:Conjugal transfer protein TraH n=1 Tax=Rouxiella silvae TaxID=1646373 RepID=A0ABX3TVH3_9GAMM|nr:conjugal transfer pilus assembly protein TraH [Rouxiella silvae]ORJ19230.1 conjugal transfer protein TraH [Rouxiella silvae]